MIKDNNFRQGKTVYSVDNGTINKILIQKRFYKMGEEETFYQKFKGIDENGLHVIEQGINKEKKQMLYIVSQNGDIINVSDPVSKLITTKKELNKEITKGKEIPFIVYDEFGEITYEGLSEAFRNLGNLRLEKDTCKIYVD